jgi:hypothetical protein
MIQIILCRLNLWHQWEHKDTYWANWKTQRPEWKSYCIVCGRTREVTEKENK